MDLRDSMKHRNLENVTCCFLCRFKEFKLFGGADSVICRLTQWEDVGVVLGMGWSVHTENLRNSTLNGRDWACMIQWRNETRKSPPVVSHLSIWGIRIVAVAGWGICSLHDARIYEKIVLELRRSVGTENTSNSTFNGCDWACIMFWSTWFSYLIWKHSISWHAFSLCSLIAGLWSTFQRRVCTYPHPHGGWRVDFISGMESAMDRFTDLIFVVSQKATTIGRSESRIGDVEFRWGLLVFVTWQGGWCIAISRNQNPQKCEIFRNTWLLNESDNMIKFADFVYVYAVLRSTTTLRMQNLECSVF